MKKLKRTNVSKNRKPIMNRLQKYSKGSQGLAVLTGLLGQTAISSGTITSLTLNGPNVNETFISDGSGSTGGTLSTYSVAASADLDDKIYFRGFSNRVNFAGALGASIVANSASDLVYLGIGAVVNGSSPLLSAAYGQFTTGGSDQGDWTVDRLGAIGFKTGSDQFGFFNISWVAETDTLTILGGMYESTANTAITVTAVPEPSEYAAALGLGALGLAYYRRRSGNKTRSKN